MLNYKVVLQLQIFYGVTKISENKEMVIVFAVLIFLLYLRKHYLLLFLLPFVHKMGTFSFSISNMDYLLEKNVISMHKINYF